MSKKWSELKGKPVYKINYVTELGQMKTRYVASTNKKTVRKGLKKLKIQPKNVFSIKKTKITAYPTHK